MMYEQYLPFNGRSYIEPKRYRRIMRDFIEAPYDIACEPPRKINVRAWRDSLTREGFPMRRHPKPQDCPNETEKKLIRMLNAWFPFQWKFVGDKAIAIENRYPDFIHTRKKLIIELFGEYWHGGIGPDDSEDRTKRYAKHGFETLIIWSKELVNPQTVKAKIKEFMDKGTKEKVDLSIIRYGC